MSAGWISLDGFAPVLGQYDDTVRWNGWLCPRMDAWSAQHVLERIAADDDEGLREWDWREDGALVVTEHYDDTDVDPCVEVYEPDADGLYALGSWGWVWAADEQYVTCARCLRPVVWSEADEAWHCPTAAFREELLCLALGGLDDNGDERGHVVAGLPVHDCWEHAVPYTSDGPLGHGWECGTCGAFLQAG